MRCTPSPLISSILSLPAIFLLCVNTVAQIPVGTISRYGTDQHSGVLVGAVITLRDKSSGFQTSWRSLTGTVIGFAEPTFWEQYRWRIAIVTTLVILQTLLIVGLLLERRRKWLAIRQLTESEERFSKAFRSNPQPMSLTTLNEGKYLDVNDAFLSMSGYAREEVIDHTSVELKIFSTPEERNRLLVEPVLTNGVMRNSEMNFRTKSGASRVLLSSAELLNVAGQKCLLVASSDITDRMRSEQELTQLTVRLFNLQDEERRRIARELHDGTAQDLFAISVNLAKIHQLQQSEKSEVNELIAESQTLVDQSLQEIRTLSYLLHPPLLDQAGLVSALQWYVEGFSKRSGVYVEVVAQSIGRLPSEVEMALFRVVQEALTNVRRHSGSEIAKIRLERNVGNVILKISDQGHGLMKDAGDTAEASSMGVGISGMRQRLRQLGGALEILSNDLGTTISAVVPLTNGVNHVTDSSRGRS